MYELVCVEETAPVLCDCACRCDCYCGWLWVVQARLCLEHSAQLFEIVHEVVGGCINRQDL